MPAHHEIVACKIHPGIGIARVGNSPNHYFIGPEAPGVNKPPRGGYKDAGDPSRGVPPRVKRQGVRFRIFGYDSDGRMVREMTASEVEITWTVHLANEKAEWFEFRGRDGENRPPKAPRRNRTIKDRNSLIIDPGERTITGPNQSAQFTGGKFMGIQVPLGEIRTDRAGRLLTLGGFGKSGTSDPKRLITTYANNDRWYDDVSDGLVTARVSLKNGRLLPVTPSWVIVGPPDFAPATTNLVTLYDIAIEAAVARGWIQPPERPSFTEQIYPIFARVALLQWVQQRTLDGHGPDAEEHANFFLILDELANNQPEQEELRHHIFEHLRDPNAKGAAAKKTANEAFMPLLSGDDGDKIPGRPGTWFTLTKTQYAMMRQWAEGEFEADWQGAPAPSTKVTPEGLDRAALENCAGGPFFPGIEASWVMRNSTLYAEPFRLDHQQLTPGDITKHSAVPWQADFFECREHWWPAQRPDEVLTFATYEQIQQLDSVLSKLNPKSKKFAKLKAQRDALWRDRAPWARGVPDSSPEGDNAMVTEWTRMGFLVNQLEDGTPLLLNGEPQIVETERNE